MVLRENLTLFIDRAITVLACVLRLKLLIYSLWSLTFDIARLLLGEEASWNFKRSSGWFLWILVDDGEG